jgi:hypothetical protein
MKVKYKCKPGRCGSLDYNRCCYGCEKKDDCSNTCDQLEDIKTTNYVIDGIEKPICENLEEVEGV